MINAAIVGLGWWGKTLVEATQGSDLIRFTAGTTRTLPRSRPLRIHKNCSPELRGHPTDPNINAVVLAIRIYARAR